MESDKQGLVRTIMMGGTQAKQEIAAYNQDVDPMCDLCGKAASTSDHIKWECAALEDIRRKADPEVRAIPRKYLPASVRCCIAPAMQTNGLTSYWGREVDSDLNGKTQKMLGIDKQLTTPGKDADVTKARQEALEILDETERGRMNARQTMMKHKQGHGAGENAEFPTKLEIQQNMHGIADDVYVSILGDGSYTTPDKWWCALGGAGCWIPNWNSDKQHHAERGEQNLAAPANGQTGSSTRMELAAWIIALSQPIRSCYATDSASMLGKALHLIEKAKELE